jgi:transcriptional regulator with XRE-family HTH domain
MPSLRQIRIARLLTIRELAQRAGVAPSTVYLLEAGRSRPSLRVIRRLSAALEVAPETVDEFHEVVWLPDTAAAVEHER